MNEQGGHVQYVHMIVAGVVVLVIVGVLVARNHGR
jgi:hypothetical protein